MKTLFERMSDIARGEHRALGRRPVSGLAEVDQVRRPNDRAPFGTAERMPHQVPSTTSTEGRGK